MILGCPPYTLTILFVKKFKHFPYVQVQEMRSIDNIFIIGDVRKFSFTPDDRESDLTMIKNTVLNDMKLEKYLNAWKEVSRYPGKIYPTAEEWKTAADIYDFEIAENVVDEVVSSKGRKRGCDPSLAKDHSVLSYRVTCERTGKHSFESGQVAAAIGGELQDKYHWIVDLTMYHLEVVCKVTQGSSHQLLNFRIQNEI